MINTGLIESLDELQKFVDRMICEGRPIAGDIETGYEGPPRDKASLHPEENFISGISFSNDRRWARYVPIAHDEPAPNLPSKAVAEIMRPMVETGLFVAHNAKFELRCMARWFANELDMPLPDAYFPVRSDTMIEAYLLSEWRAVGLKELTKECFGYEQATLSSLFPDMAKNKMKSIRFNILELTPGVVSYACDDAAWCLALHERNYPTVKDKMLFRVEMEILPILCEMEDYGVMYDWSMMQTAAVELESFLQVNHTEIMSELSRMLERPVALNINSSKQLRALLYSDPPEGLGFKTTRYTKMPDKKTGEKQMSTDAIALATLAKKHEVVHKILEWKEQRVLLTRYLQKYQKDYTYASDGRTHPNHLQCAVGTGRFAVSDPPYQQTPKKYQYTSMLSGREFHFPFREVIRAAPDHYLLGYDYSQIELRVMAGESGEPTLIHAFENDEDVHRATASLMLSVPKDQVTADQRAVGKTMNFALLYGMGAKSLGERLGLSKEEAQRLYDQYFSSYSAISAWVNKVTVEGKMRGHSLTRFGRKFTIWELQSDDGYIKSKGERLCVNAPIQGGAADYMKLAMIRARKALDKAGLAGRVHLIMNIHDALIFEVEKTLEPKHVVPILQPAVAYPVEGWPKIVAEWSVGTRWGSMKDIELLPDGRIRVVGEEDDDDPFAESGLVDEDGELVSPPPAVDESVLRAVAAAAGTDRPVGTTSQPGPAPDPGDAPRSPSQPGPAADPPPRPVPEERPEGERADTSPRRLIVSLASLPTTHQWASFANLVNGRPGPNEVVVSYDGQEKTLEATTGLTVADGPVVSLALGGAQVYYASDSVDTTEIVSGLAL